MIYDSLFLRLNEMEVSVSLLCWWTFNILFFKYWCSILLFLISCLFYNNYGLNLWRYYTFNNSYLFTGVMSGNLRLIRMLSYNCYFWLPFFVQSYKCESISGGVLIMVWSELVLTLKWGDVFLRIFYLLITFYKSAILIIVILVVLPLHL